MRCGRPHQRQSSGTQTEVHRGTCGGERGGLKGPWPILPTLPVRVRKPGHLRGGQLSLLPTPSLFHTPVPSPPISCTPCLLSSEHWPLSPAPVVVPRAVTWSSQPWLTTTDLSPPPVPQAPELVVLESHLHHLLNVLHHDRLIQLGFGSRGPLLQHWGPGRWRAGGGAGWLWKWSRLSESQR